MDEEVNMSFMPNFLDNESIEYLFIIAKKKIKFQKLNDYIKLFKIDSCNNLNIRKFSLNNILSLSPIKLNENVFKLI